MVVWGPNYLSFPHMREANFIQIGGARISLLRVIIILSATAIMAGLLLVVPRTRLGTAMRATAQNREVAGLMGVHLTTLISAAFLIGPALAAVAGVMITPSYGVAQYPLGFLLGLKSFTAAMLGGLVNLGPAL